MADKTSMDFSPPEVRLATAMAVDFELAKEDEVRYDDDDDGNPILQVGRDILIEKRLCRRQYNGLGGPLVRYEPGFFVSVWVTQHSANRMEPDDGDFVSRNSEPYWSIAECFVRIITDEFNEALGERVERIRERFEDEEYRNG